MVMADHRHLTAVQFLNYLAVKFGNRMGGHPAVDTDNPPKKSGGETDIVGNYDDGPGAI